jgi:coenzyme F420-reducing hydrogenase gamma subunit
MTSDKRKRLKLAVISLTACEGCQATILDLGKKFLDLLKKDYELVEMPLIEDKPDVEKYDVVIVEGTAINKQDEKRLKRARKKSKILVALGACACLGGIPEIKNYIDKMKAVKYVYQRIKDIDNPEIKPLREIVKVDLEIPGCPPTKEEILEILKQIRLGKIPKIPQRPVCFECQLLGNECLLQKGELCLGPISLGGCNAICPSSNYRCEGCRGPILDKSRDNLKNLLKLFKERADKDEIKFLFQKFGLEDDVFE